MATTALAATQTGHVADSASFAWWCVTVAAADHSVSSRHRNAIAFHAERISPNPLR